MKKAAIYERVSTDRQAEEGIGLDVQDRANHACAAENGYTVAHVYREAGSGGDLSQRRELARLLDNAKQGEFEAVIVYCVDRLTRDPFHLGWLRTELQRCGVILLFATEQFADSLEGDLMQQMKGTFAKEERRKIGDRNRKAYRERAQQKRPPHIGPAPFGYEPEGDTLAILEVEAEVVRRLFTLAGVGYSACAIAKLLNEEGVPPPSALSTKNYAMKGEKWWVPVVVRLLRDPIYKGQRAVRQWKSIKVEALGEDAEVLRHREKHEVRSRMVPRPTTDWLIVPVPAIVTEAEWDAAQVALTDRRGVNHTRNLDRPALLRGLARCAKCGRALHPDWQKTGRLVYRCTSRSTPNGHCGVGAVPGEEAERQAWREVAKFLADPDKVAHELESQAQAGPDPALTKTLERLQRERTAKEKEQERLLMLYAGGGNVPLALVQEKLSEAEQVKARLTEEIGSVQTKLQATSFARGRLVALAAYCRELARDLNDADFTRKRKLLEELGVTVEAGVPGEGHPWVVDGVSYRVPAEVVRRHQERERGGILERGGRT